MNSMLVRATTTTCNKALAHFFTYDPAAVLAPIHLP
jgi:hypothetical protein